YLSVEKQGRISLPLPAPPPSLWSYIESHPPLCQHVNLSFLKIFHVRSEFPFNSPGNRPVPCCISACVATNQPYYFDMRIWLKSEAVFLHVKRCGYHFFIKFESHRRL
ncbi:hypothetical protein, partial [Daeguia caeni]